MKQYGDFLLAMLAAALGFTVSLSLNSALTKSFDAMYDEDVDGDGLRAAWLYFAAALVLAVTGLFVLVVVMRPWFERASKCTADCSRRVKLLVPVAGAAALALLVALPATLAKRG